MIRRSLAISTALLLLSACGGTGHATDYFVDYAGGSDDAAGTAPNAAWRHAPGDPDASGKAAAAQLGAGDIVRFKGGVAYRGSITVNGDGAEGKPLTFTSYGTGRAVFDGADPITSAAPCSSQAACGGAAGWHALTLVSFTAPPTAFIKFYDATGPLVEAQMPAPADAFYADDIEGYAVSPLADKAIIESGILRAPDLARRLAGAPGGTLSIWIAGNQVVRRQVTGVEGDTLRFTPDNIRLYADRDGRYALMGVAGAIAAPGQYAIIAPGRAVVQMRPGGGTLSIGNGRGGFNLGGREWITIDNVTFTHQTGDAGQQREGLPIVRPGKPGRGITITNNRFENSALWNGQGVITLRNLDGGLVANNFIDTIERGSGLRIGGKVSHLKVIGNTINRVGRTGVAFLGVSDSEITGNTIDGLRGIHGNGISLYLTNRRISVTDNRVTGTNRPMTFHGDKNQTAPGDHDFVIERNIFIATDDAQAALTSWGAATRGVTIRQNVLIAPKAGLLLNGSDSGIVVAGNYTSDIIVNDKAGRQPGWQIGDNPTVGKTLRLRTGEDVKPLCRAVGLAPGTTLGGAKC